LPESNKHQGASGTCTLVALFSRLLKEQRVLFSEITTHGILVPHFQQIVAKIAKLCYFVCNIFHMISIAEMLTY